MRGPIRIINTMFWCWVALSNFLTPVVTDGDFWTEKIRQFFQLGPVDDMPRLLARAVIPFLLWLFLDWIICIQRTTKRKI